MFYIKKLSQNFFEILNYFSFLPPPPTGTGTQHTLGPVQVGCLGHCVQQRERNGQYWDRERKANTKEGQTYAKGRSPAREKQ